MFSSDSVPEVTAKRLSKIPVPLASHGFNFLLLHQEEIEEESKLGGWFKGGLDSEG